jgi:hypothetical protein
MNFYKKSLPEIQDISLAISEKDKKNPLERGF